MGRYFRITWILVLAATLAVLASGAFLARAFVREAFVTCQGSLRSVSTAELGSPRLDARGTDDLVVGPDDRVTWRRDARTCSEVTVKGTPTILHDDVTGLFVVRRGDRTVGAFRKIDDRGDRLRTDRLLEGHLLTLVVF